MKQRRWKLNTYGKGFVRTDGSEPQLEVWSTDEDGRPTIQQRRDELGREPERSAITFVVQRSAEVTPHTDDASSRAVLERLLRADGRFEWEAGDEWLFG